MKQLKKFKLLTVILVCALVLPAIMVTILASAAENPFSVSAQSDLDLWVDEEIAPTDPNITENSFIVGDTLYNPVLTAQTNTAGVPKEWLAVRDKLVPWPNNAYRNNSTGAVTGLIIIIVFKSPASISERG